MAKSLPKKQRRKRLGPSDAQRNILTAGLAVLTELGPDRAGLKEVSQAAGVSHGLITHYFGRFEALVAQVMTQAAAEARQHLGERLMAMTDQSLEAALDVFLDVMSEPQHGRLIAWSLLSHREVTDGFFGGPSLRRVADVIEARLRRQHPGAAIQRDEIDRLLVLVLVSGLALSFSRSAVFRALGRQPNDDEWVAFRNWLRDVVRARVRDSMGIGQPAA